MELRLQIKLNKEEQERYKNLQRVLGTTRAGETVRKLINNVSLGVEKNKEIEK